MREKIVYSRCADAVQRGEGRTMEEIQQKKSPLFSRDWWREMAFLNLGTLLTAVGIYYFKFPNHFATGGVSGISILLAEMIPNYSTATVNLVLNLALLLIGALFVGRSFGIRTAYATVVSSWLTVAFDKLTPLAAPMTSQPLLELLFAVALPAVGAAMLFDVNASSGGTDIIAMMLKKYTRMHIGTGLALADCIVAAGACFVFGMEAGLFSLLGLFLKSVLVDTVMDNLRTCKVFQIITDYPEPICQYIIENLNRSSTVHEGRGAFTHKEHEVIMTVVTRSQAVRLQRYVRSVDPHSFITITSSSEIVGKGFRGMSE